MSGVLSLTIPSDEVTSVNVVTAANGEKPVLSYAEQGIRKVSKKSQPVKSLATAGQRVVLLVPAEEEQHGQPEALEPQGQAEAHSVSKSSGRPPLKGSANDLPAHVGTCPILGVGREEQKEEEVLPAASVSRSHDRVAECGPCVKVNHPSSLASAKDDLASSLKFGIPMCGPTPEPRVRTNLNPAAEGFVPTPDQVQAEEELLLQQVSQSLLAWHQGAGCSKDQPWLWRDPMHGPALGVGRV